MIVSFAALDPDLLRERMRPGGKKPPLSLRIFSLVLFMHWIVAGLDRGRYHWSDGVPRWLQVALDTLAGVRGEMARLYRLGLNGRIRSDEMTRFIYALKEIRACLEAETLTLVQQRLALLSQDMDNQNGQRVLHQPAFPRS